MVTKSSVVSARITIVLNYLGSTYYYVSRKFSLVFDIICYILHSTPV